jgi:hypothetical protein
MKGTEYALYGPKNIPGDSPSIPTDGKLYAMSDNEINVRGILPSQGPLIRAFL